MMNLLNPNPGFPLHGLDTIQTKGWVRFASSRPEFASLLAKKYRKLGVGLVSATGFLFVLIDPTGKFRTLPKPRKRYEMFQLANAPDHKTECACRIYFDPEVEGSWSGRDGREGHHPFCQFSNTAISVHEKMMNSALHRQSEKLSPQARPDEWINAKKDAES